MSYKAPNPSLQRKMDLQSYHPALDCHPTNVCISLHCPARGLCQHDLYSALLPFSLTNLSSESKLHRPEDPYYGYSDESKVPHSHQP